MENPILIIGAGVSGLTLAQACRKRGVPFRIFERDASATHRGAGWGLTLNWALETFKSMLSEDILERLPETYVNREGREKGEAGTFTFFDLSTGEAKWKVPLTADRTRVSRERLRALMLRGLEVEWEKRLVDVKKHSHGVTAVFEDGTEARGAVLMGCDGAKSQLRHLCHPEAWTNSQLPVRFIGAGVRYPESKIAEMRRLDPYFLQGSDPRQDVFFWFSFLHTPTDASVDKASGYTMNPSEEYYCQIMISWPYRDGSLGRSEPIEMPTSRAERLAWMKTLAKDWVEPFRSIVLDIPEDESQTEIMAIHLADWLPRRTTAYGGRVMLLGDSARAMVMYRGDGANQAIYDVSMVLKQVEPLLKSRVDDVAADDARWAEAAERYEVEMIDRTELAVLASRRACLDAHDYPRLNDQSPLVRRRLMRADLEEGA